MITDKTKLGRNDLCSCGSEKKYKKCCLKKGRDIITQYGNMPIFKQYPQEDENHSIVTLESTPINEVGLNLEKKILNYIDNTNPSHINDAKSHLGVLLFRLIFRGCSRENVDNIIEHAMEPFVIPWALYNWVPDLFEQMDQDRDEKNIEDNTIALKCNQKNDLNLTLSETEFFNKLNATYFSYYKVKRIDKDGFIIEDLLFNIEYHIVDNKLEQKLKIGSIIYARIVFFQERNIIYGIWPMLIPELYSDRIDDFKRQCIKLNNNKPLVGHLFRTRFEFDLRDILSLIVLNMVERAID